MNDGQDILIERAVGAEVAGLIPDIARLRMQVFRDYPYLYDGDEAYEQRYLKYYAESQESIVVVARAGADIVGASTGIPLSCENPSFQRPFIVRAMDVAKIFYCGESVLMLQYRGQGVYKHFFAERERHARALQRFDWICFCAVQRDGVHPLRPVNYRPLDDVWRHFGYVRCDDITMRLSWRQVDERAESEKTMVFWLKSLNSQST